MPLVNGIPVRCILQIDLSEHRKMYDWLKSLMQNPIYEDESLEERLFRETMFKTLDYIRPIDGHHNPIVNTWEDDIPF